MNRLLGVVDAGDKVVIASFLVKNAGDGVVDAGEKVVETCEEVVDIRSGSIWQRWISQ